MRQILAITVLQFRKLLKSKGSIIMMFGMPLMLTFIFGLMQGDGNSSAHSYPLAVVNEDQSFVSERLVDALKAEENLKVRLVSRAELDKLFSDKVIESAAVIPAGFQKQLTEGSAPDLEQVTAPAGNLDMAVRPVLNRDTARVASDFQIAYRLSGQSSDAAKLKEAFDKVQVERKNVSVGVTAEEVQRPDAQKVKGNGASDRALGFIVLFVMMVVFLMGGTILQERQDGTWGRLLTTPTGRVRLLIGYLFSFYVVGLFQFSSLVIITTLFFKVAWGPLLPLFVVASAFILCAAGLGLFIAGIVRTAEQQKVIGMVVVNATSMLGGVYWPLDFVGDTMRRIGYLTPQAWAMDGFREVMQRGGSFAGLTFPLTVLGALAVIFMTAGIMRVRFE